MQNICGTDPHPVKYRAKKYKIAERSFGLSDFRQMMSHLPEHVPDTEIREMFMYADKDRDGRISYDEFLVGQHWTCQRPFANFHSSWLENVRT